MPYINASKNAGLKKNRITKRQTSGYINASQRDEKNRGGLLGGAEYITKNLVYGAGSVLEGIGDIGAATGDLLRGDTAMAKYRFLDNDTADAREKLTKKYNPTGAMQLAGDVSSGIGNSLIFMIPYVGPYLAAAGYTGMGISGAAEKTGDVGPKEIGYGAASGGLEFALDSLTGGIGKAGKNIGAAVTRKLGREAAESAAKAAGVKTASKLAGKITGRGLAGTVLKEVGLGALGEGGEEALAEIIDPGLLKLFNIDENAEWDWKQIAYAGLVGGLSGGLMTAGPAAINYKSAAKAGRSIREKGQAEELVRFAKDTALKAASRKQERYNAAAEAAKVPADAGTLKKLAGAVNPLSESRKQTRAGKRVEDIADKVEKNISAYERYLQNPKKSPKELEISDAILGELRGNVFLLENASLLEVYEEAILELDGEDKQAVVDAVNREAEKAGREKHDYTIADLEKNTDDILTMVATEKVRKTEYEDLFQDLFQKRENENVQVQEAEAPAQTAAEPVQGAEGVSIEEVADQAAKPATGQITPATKAEEDERTIRKTASTLGLGKVETEMMVNSYNRGTDMDAETFAKAFAEGVFYGKQNRNPADIQKDTLLGSMNPYERQYALEAGRIAAIAEEDRRAEETAQKKAPARQPEMQGKKSYVTLDLTDGKRMKQRSERDYAVYNAAKVLGEALKTDIILHSTMGTTKSGDKINGRYDRKTNTIHVALDAGMDAQGTALFTLAHEVTHYIREWAPREYQALSDFVGEHISRDMGALIEQKKALLKKLDGYKDMTESDLTDAAQEEVVADALETILTNGNVLEDLATYDKSLWEKFKDWIVKAIHRIREAYNGLKPNSQAAQTLRETLDTLDEVERLFTEGVREAGERVRTADWRDTQSSLSAELDSDRITVNMSENERARILRNKTITPPPISVDKQFDVSFEELVKNRKSQVEKPLIKKLREMGHLTEYQTNAIDIAFDFTAAGLRKSMNSQVSDYGGNLGDLAKVVLNMQAILDSSVLIEIHTDKAIGTPRENPRLVQTFVLLGAYHESNTITPVQFEVKQYIDGDNRLYLAVALTKIETGVMGDTASLDGRRTRLLPVSDIIIPQFIQKINPRDEKFFKYIPDEFLNADQKEAKQRALAKDAEKYGRKDSISEETAPDTNDEHMQVIVEKLSVDNIDNRTFTYKELVAKGNVAGVVIDKKQQVPLLSDGNIDTQAVLQAVRSKCKTVPMKGGGTTYHINVPDIGRNVRITGDGITHGFKAKRNGKHTTSSKITARATLELPYILGNSIEVNRLNVRGNQGILFSRVMIGTVGMEDISGNTEYYAVRMVVEERADHESVLVDLDILGNLYAANAKKVDRQGHQGITNVKTPSGTATIYAYNIAHFLNDVKGVFENTFSNDVYQALGVSRKQDDFSKGLKYSVSEETAPDTNDGRKDTESPFDAAVRRMYEREKPVQEHILFADTLMGAAQSEQEYRAVKRYKAKAEEMAEAEARRADLRKKTAALNREIELLKDRKKNIDRDRPEPEVREAEAWIETELNEAQARKQSYMSEMDDITEMLTKEQTKLLSLSAAKPLQNVMRELQKKADAMERSAEQAKEREKETKEWAKATVREANEREKEKTAASREWAKETVKKVRAEEREKGRKYKVYLDRKAGESQERIEITARKRTVIRELGSLSTKLYHPTKTNHVPHELQELALKTLKATDPSAFGKNRNNIREMGELAAKIERLERKASLTAGEQEKLNTWKNRYDNLERETIPLRKQAEALLTAFVEYNKTMPEDQRYPEGFINIMTARVGEIESKPLVEMGLRSLEAVETFVTMLSHQITTANNTFATERTLRISDLGQKASAEAADSKPLKVLSPTGKEWAAMSGIRNFFWKNLKPLTVFEAIGSKTFADLFQNVLDGEDVWARDIVEAREKILDARKRHGYKSWDLDERTEIQTRSGTVNLSLSERLALYAYSFREQAESHLQGGGFVLDPRATEQTKIKNISVDALAKRLNDSTRYVMDKEMLGNLAARLTEEQRAYVEEMQKYLTSLGKKGNEVSRKLYGIDIFTEEFYFPIKVKSEYLEVHTGKTGDPNIKNRGMTKEVQPNAKDPLVLQGFDEIMVDHINNMATYHAFVLPMEDLRRVLNYKPVNYKTDENGDVILDDNGLPVADSDAAKQYDTLQAVIESKYGQKANDYIIQLMRDLNGGARRDAAAGIIDRGITAFKRASTMASLSVLVQQPTSIFRAAAFLDAKYLADGMKTVGIKTPAEHRKLWEWVKKYAPVAIIKEMGGYDTGVGTRTGDYLNATEYEKGERVKGFLTDDAYRAEVFGYGAAYADELAWIRLFEACVSEQADKLKADRDSEEVLKAAGKRFEEVVRRTQVYDSTLTRSENMRSKDTGMKMATAFMAEPTTVVSMIAEGLMKFERGDKKFLRNTAGAVGFSLLANALISSLVYAMRDDDENKSYGEKYLSTLAMETAEAVNPLEYFPVFRDFMSLVKGYEVERTDMALVGDLLNQVQSLSSSKKTIPQKVIGVSGAVASFFGLAMTNIVRDANGLIYTFLKQTDTERLTGKGLSVAMMEEFDTMFNLFDEKTKNGYQLYQSVLDGDNKHFARVSTRYESSKDVELALRQALRTYDPRITEAALARMNGELDVYESLVKQIETEGKFDRNITIRAINNQMTWIKDNDTAATVPKDDSAEDEPEALYKSSDLNDALERGDSEDFEAIYYVLLTDKKEAGKTEAQAKSAIKSSVTSYWKKQYIAAWERNDTKEIKRIQSILLSTGLYGTRNDVATTGQDWVKAYAASKTKK